MLFQEALHLLVHMVQPHRELVVRVSIDLLLNEVPDKVDVLCCTVALFGASFEGCRQRGSSLDCRLVLGPGRASRAVLYSHWLRVHA